MKRQRDGASGARNALENGATSRRALPESGSSRPANNSTLPAARTANAFVGGPVRWLSQDWLLGLLLVLGTIVAYQPVWQAGFIWDDDRHVTQNRLLLAPDGLKQIWFSLNSIQYYPMVFTTFRLEQALWGLNPAGYHWVNLLLHAASAVLVWRVLGRLNVPGAWLAAGVFALHPVNVESVAWISERKNTLCMLFYLLSVLLYLRSESTRETSAKDEAGKMAEGLPSPSIRHPPSSLFYWLSLGAFVLALLSKTAASPLPFVLLGLAWWRRGRVTRRDVWRSAPFFAASLILGLMTVWFERHQTSFEVVRDDSVWSRLAVAGRAVWFYLYEALVPVHLVPIYPRWKINPSNALSYVPVLLLVSAFAVFWHFRRSWGKAWLFCAGYSVVMLLPILGFVNIGYMSFSLVADHWQYFSIIGPIALASAGLATAFGSIPSPEPEVQSPASPSPPRSHRMERARSVLSTALGGALLAVLGVLTWRQSAIYTDSEALWRATVAVNPGSWRAQNNLGIALLQKGRLDEAILYDQRALKLEPDSAEIHNNLASAFLQEGRLDEAITHYQAALKTQPDFAVAHNNLGNLLRQKGQVQEALAHYKRAVELQPDLTQAYCNLASVLLQQGQVDEALTQFQKALDTDVHFQAASPSAANVAKTRRRPGDDPATDEGETLLISTTHYTVGNILVRRGRVGEAIAHFQAALEIRPDFAEAAIHLAWVLATTPQASLRNGARAVELARRGDELSGGHSLEAIGTLAAAYAEAGRFSEAVASAQRGLTSVAAQTNQALLNQIQAQIKLYEAGSPLRDTGRPGN